MIKVSVVIPVFNTEKYIRECLNSVLGQTFKEIEIICINDGSTDNSLKIAEEYIDKDKRLKIISNAQNKGVTNSRNVGLEAASGKYIFYLDSDDWINNDLLEMLYSLADEYNADVVLGAMIYEWEKRSEKQSSKLKDGLYIGEEKINSFQDIYDIDDKEIRIRWNVCGNLYNREKFYKYQVRVDERIKVGEDMAVFIPFIMESERVYVTSLASYHYRQHRTSTMHKNSSKAMDYYYLWEYLKPYLIDKPIVKQQVAHICCTGIENDYVGLFNLKKQNFYMFPYELIAPHSRIVIFGAGLVGQAYYRQLKNNNYCIVELIVDNNYEMNDDKEYLVVSPSLIKDAIYDYVIISVLNKEILKEINNQLLCVYKVPKEKIIKYIPKMVADFVDFGF